MTDKEKKEVAEEVTRHMDPSKNKDIVQKALTDSIDKKWVLKTPFVGREKTSVGEALSSPLWKNMPSKELRIDPLKYKKSVVRVTGDKAKDDERSALMQKNYETAMEARKKAGNPNKITLSKEGQLRDTDKTTIKGRQLQEVEKKVEGYGDYAKNKGIKLTPDKRLDRGVAGVNEYSARKNNGEIAYDQQQSREFKDDFGDDIVNHEVDHGINPTTTWNVTDHPVGSYARYSDPEMTRFISQVKEHAIANEGKLINNPNELADYAKKVRDNPSGQSPSLGDRMRRLLRNEPEPSYRPENKLNETEIRNEADDPTLNHIRNMKQSDIEQVVKNDTPVNTPNAADTGVMMTFSKVRVYNDFAIFNRYGSGDAVAYDIAVALLADIFLGPFLIPFNILTKSVGLISRIKTNKDIFDTVYKKYPTRNSLLNYFALLRMKLARYPEKFAKYESELKEVKDSEYEDWLRKKLNRNTLPKWLLFLFSQGIYDSIMALNSRGKSAEEHLLEGN